MSYHANQGNGNLRLPEFWPHAPILWFARAECLFMLRGVTTQLDRFCHVVGSLPHEVMRACAELVETTPADDPYTQLKERLLAAHQLTPYQRGEKLLDLPNLGASKPSELMHQMLELCPKGDETSTLFRSLFLRRLPADLRVMLAHLDHADLKELARKADELWALRLHQEVLAVIQPEGGEEEQETIAAVSGPSGINPRGGGSGSRRAGNRNKFSNRGRGSHKQPSKQPSQGGKPDQAGLFGQVCYTSDTAAMPTPAWTATPARGRETIRPGSGQFRGPGNTS